MPKVGLVTQTRQDDSRAAARPFRMRSMIIAVWLIAVSIQAAEPDVAFWVWHRATDISSIERDQLTNAGCKTLYWHTGMIAVRKGVWAGDGGWLAPESNPSSTKLRCVPVLRGIIGGLKSLPKEPDGLIRLLQRARERWNADEVQLDFDCPDRLLGNYAAQLARCREAIKPARLSITALAGWAAQPDFGALQASVDELLPMFYDLEPDTPEQARNGSFEPLLDATVFARHLKAWQHCETPWRVGLPCFARVSLFDPDGRSRGHLRDWSWDQIVFHGALRDVPLQGAGLHALEVTQQTRLHATDLLQGQKLVVREVDLTVARQCARQAHESGARGLVWFRLPAESTPAGWSLTQALSLSTDAPRLQLRVEKDALVLSNNGASDLPPRFAAQPDQQRGWQIEIETNDSSAVFREIVPGDFASVTPGSELNRATRLTLWFANLKAGTIRRAPLFQLAPGTAIARLRWRCLGDSDNVPWQSFSP